MKTLYSKTIDKNWKKYNELYDKAQKKGYGLWDRMTKSQFEEAMTDVRFSDSFSKQKTSYADYIFKEYSRTVTRSKIKIYKSYLNDVKLTIKSSKEEVADVKHRIWEKAQGLSYDDQLAFWALYKGGVIKDVD